MKVIILLLVIILFICCNGKPVFDSKYTVEINSVTTGEFPGIPIKNVYKINSKSYEDAYMQALHKYYASLTSARILSGPKVLGFVVRDSLDRDIKTKLSKHVIDSLTKLSLIEPIKK